MAKTKTYTTKDGAVILRYTKEKTVIYKNGKCYGTKGCK